MSPGQRLDALIEATGKLKAGVARVATRDLLRRLVSREAYCLACDWKAYVMASGPLLFERVCDAARALRGVDFQEWSVSTVTNLLLDELGGSNLAFL